MTESRFVRANGLRHHVLDHGGDGPVLVLVHGLTANAHFFDGVARAGLAAARRILAVDLRGRGLSDTPPSGYTMADHAADLFGVIDEFGLDRVALGGHSFGGLLAIWVAAHAPERVERTLLLDVPAEVDATVLEQIGPSLARLGRSYASREAYFEQLRGQPYFAEDGWNDDLAAYYAGDVEELPDGSVRSRCTPEAIREAVEGTMTPDWPALAARVVCPTLLVRTTGAFGPHGAPPLISREAARRTAELLPAGRLLEVAGNHVTFASGVRAPALASALLEFLDTAESGGVG
jgi:pimeloyl-ACP methyl ester carboxylesterase